MGISTNGIICFGIDFGESELPWTEDEDGIEGWWKDLQGYEPLYTDLFNSKGDYASGYTQTKWDENYAAEQKFEKEHPLPIEEILHCSGDDSLTILAVKGTEIRASRGYPEKFSPESLTVTPAQINTLVEFCQKYCQQYATEDLIDLTPSWILCSMYW